MAFIRSNHKYRKDQATSYLASIIDIFYNYLNLTVVTVQHAMEWSRKVFNFVTLSLNSVGS